MQSSIESQYEKMGISQAVYAVGEQAEKKLAKQFQTIDGIAEINQGKVLQAMREQCVSEACLVPSTGYGYHDLGRDKLEAVYAAVFHTEDALVRPQIASGTHALHIALSGNLRPGDRLLSPVGKPYDTLEEVIGIRPSTGSLAEYGIGYDQVDLLADGSFDFDAIRQALRPETKVVSIQRSRGYQLRPSFSSRQIGNLIAFFHELRPDLICLVDNCYGEFVEETEPSDWGADLVVGSLIKNPGGGLAPSGGYLVGKKEAIAKASYRLTAPGLGKEVGATFGTNASYLQGLFLAPTVAASAVKGACFAAAIYASLGYDVYPAGEEERHDSIQAITLGSREAMLAFCEGIQAASPIDGFVKPEPAPMPGYEDEVIMAAGTFIQGSSIELSADGPLREPYTIYLQGGLTWPHAKYGILLSLQKMVTAGLIRV